jgi:hypothetical protein
MPPQITPRIIGIVNLKSKQDNKHDAYPKLQVKVVAVTIEGNTPKGINGYTDDKQQTEHKSRQMKG